MADEEPIALGALGAGLEIDDGEMPLLTSHHECSYGEPMADFTKQGSFLDGGGPVANRIYRSNTADCHRLGYGVCDGARTASPLVYVGNASQVGQVHSRVLTAHPDMDRSLFGRASRSQTIRRRRALSDEMLDFDDEDGEPEPVVQMWRARPPSDDDDDEGADDDDDTIQFSARVFGRLPQIIDDPAVRSVLCSVDVRGLPGEVIGRIEWYRNKCVENGWEPEERMLSHVLAEATGTKKSCP